MPEMFDVQTVWYENLCKRLTTVRALKKQIDDQKTVLSNEWTVMDKVEDALNSKIAKVNEYLKDNIRITGEQRDFLLMRSAGEPEEIPIIETAEQVTRKIRQVTNIEQAKTEQSL